MKNNQLAQKINISSLQVLKTLLVLMQGDYTMAELVDRLNESEETPVFNNSVVSKYINTCRYCGITIPKIHNRYYVSSLPFGLDITDSDANLIDKLQNAVQDSMSARSRNLFNKFTTILEKFSNRELVRLETHTRNYMLEAFDKALISQNKIKLILKNKKFMECIPLEIIEKNKKVFLNVYYENSEKLIMLDRITAMEILKEKFKKVNGGQTVVYKLKGALAKNYQLRENEHIITRELPDYITVANRGENKEILLSRLLRYQELCEIENPISYREDMKKIISKTLENYGE